MLTLDVVAISYGFGAVLFAVLTLLLVTAWRGRLQGGLLVLASAVSTLWCGAHVTHALFAIPGFWLLQVFEVVRDATWIAFLLGLLGTQAAGSAWRGMGVRAVAVTAAGLCIGLLALIVSAKFGWGLGLGERALTRLFLVGQLGLAVTGLVLVHQLFRNTEADQRWGVKFLFFGVGGLFAYDLYLYSVALLFTALEPVTWAARGLVDAIVVPFIAVAARRNPRWSVEVFVSRHVVFHSTALLGVGIYLMLMSAVGYYIRLYGGTWGGVSRSAFLFLALLLLLALLLSGQARARLRIFLIKHFYKNKYDYREEWLKFTQALSASAPGSDPHENIIAAFGAVVGSPRGVMWTRQLSDHFQPVASVAAPIPTEASVRPENSLIRFLEHTGWVVYLDEFQRDPGLYSGLVLPDWITGLRDPWVIVPMMQNRDLIAFIVLSHPDTTRDLNWEDSDLLKTCGRQAASYLALLKVSEALTDARQFEAFNRLSAFVVHDLKNLVAQLSLVVSNAQRHMHSPGFIEDVVVTVDNAASKMNRLLAQLRKEHVGGGRVRTVNVAEVVQGVVQVRAHSRPAPELSLCEQPLRVMAEPDRLSAVVEHLVQNAQEATQDDGRVLVSVARKESLALIKVEDTGCGMDARFISERLFRPFDTTKGNAGMGVGAYESREFVTSCGGHLDVVSTPGEGTSICLCLPLDESDTESMEHQTLETAH